MQSTVGGIYYYHAFEYFNQCCVVESLIDFTFKYITSMHDSLCMFFFYDIGVGPLCMFDITHSCLMAFRSSDTTSTSVVIWVSYYITIFNYPCKLYRKDVHVLQYIRNPTFLFIRPIYYNSYGHRCKKVAF